MILKLIGVLCGIVGILLGLYLGLWVCAAGGIVQVIDAAKLTPVDSLNIAIGVVRFFSTGIVIWAICFIGGVIGAVFFSAAKDRERGRW